MAYQTLVQAKARQIRVQLEVTGGQTMTLKHTKVKVINIVFQMLIQMYKLTIILINVKFFFSKLRFLKASHCNPTCDCCFGLKKILQFDLCDIEK